MSETDTVRSTKPSQYRFKDYKTILSLVFFSRLIFIFIALIANWIVDDYDSSHIGLKALLSNPFEKRHLLAFERWDAVYFINIARNGYRFEQEYAFLPLMPMILRWIQPFVNIIFSGILNQDDIWIASGILVSCFFFTFASLFLYELSLKIWQRRLIALASTISFVLGPAGIFLIVPYTEPVFCMFTFGGLLILHSELPFLASIFFGLGSLTRANGLLNAGFIGYYAISKTLKCKSMTIFTIFVLWVKCAMYMVISTFGFFAFQYSAYKVFCVDKILRSWCVKMYPSIYSFVQDKYWNVGFLRYWELKQLPNFFIASFTIVFSIIGIRAFISAIRKTRKYPSSILIDDFTPYVILWSLCVFLGITTMHVNIITRFMSSMVPLFWYAGIYLSKDISKGRLRTLWFRIFILYALIGIVLYSNFFPPA